jgi:hypothetical protein
MEPDAPRGVRIFATHAKREKLAFSPRSSDDVDGGENPRIDGALPAEAA